MWTSLNLQEMRNFELKTTRVKIAHNVQKKKPEHKQNELNGNEGDFSNGFFFLLCHLCYVHRFFCEN